MFGTALIVFREVFEAALIISIVLTAARGVLHRHRWIIGGVLLGLLGSMLVASFASVLAEAAEGMGQEVFNAAVLFMAVIMLGWHNVWMARHGREMAKEMSAVGKAVQIGNRPIIALMMAVLFAVLREGSEVVLFLYGISAGGTNSAAMLSGGGIGIVGGFVAGALLYFGLLRIPERHLFNVTSWMILLLAAGMAAQAVAFLVQADILPALIATLWNSSKWLPEHSAFGQTLHALIGYDEAPSGMQLLAWSATLIIIGVAMKTLGKVQTQQTIEGAKTT
jgi:high-affinity iron transporter